MPDLVVPHRDGGQSYLFLNDGKGGFAAEIGEPWREKGEEPLFERPGLGALIDQSPGFGEGFDVGEPERRQEIGLVAEMGEDARLGHLVGTGNLVDAGRLIALAGEEVTRGGEDLFAGLSAALLAELHRRFLFRQPNAAINLTKVIL